MSAFVRAFRQATLGERFRESVTVLHSTAHTAREPNSYDIDQQHELQREFDDYRCIVEILHRLDK